MEQQENPNRHEWDVEPLPDPDAPEPLKFQETITDILRPYMPADIESDSDIQYTTNELIKAVEEHLGISQGSIDIRGIDGPGLVDYMKALGYKCVNTGGLQLQWLLKKR